ncbi:MAG: hypothetical protein WA160_15855 [Pseudobdellovibrio sp.]
MKSYLKTALIATFASLTISQTASAGLLIEPYLGYLSGQQKQSSSSKYTGTEFGARIGYTTMLGLALGAEYAGTSTSDDNSPKNDQTSGDIGIFVAYKFPVLFRVFGTYIPSPELKNTSSGLTTTLKSGNVMKLGVGYTGLPFININFEYISASYSKVEAFGASADLSPSISTTGYAISIGAPFNLF